MTSALPRISVVLMVRDAAATLAATLESVRDFGEVLIYDNGSDRKSTRLNSSH